MKRWIIIGAACLMALSGCAGDEPVAATPLPSATVTPAATPGATLAVPAPTVPSRPVSTPTPEPQPTPDETIPLPTPTPEPEGWNGDPDALTLDDFPTQPVTSGEIDQAGIYLVAQLPESDTWLYGIYHTDKSQSLVLRVGSSWRELNGTFLHPQGILPTMAYGDFDGDLEMELAIIPYEGGGTGASVFSLRIVEFGSTGWTMQTFQESDYRAIIQQSVLCSYTADSGLVTLQLGASTLDIDLAEHDLPAPTGPVSSVCGNYISFTVSGDDIMGRFSIELQGEGLPVTPLGLAQAEATVIYTGSTFGLDDLTLTSPS